MIWLVQLNATDNDKWHPIEAPDPEAAALKELACTPAPLPCEVYVSIGRERHENGAPVVVQKFVLTEPWKGSPFVVAGAARCAEVSHE